MRRWLMWAAVSLATMALKARRRFVAFIATLVLLAAAVGSWVFGWLAGPAGLPGWAPAAVVLVGGFAYGLLWPLTVVGILLFTAPTLVVWAVLVLVWLLDLAKAVWNRVRGRRFERPPLLPREPHPRF